MTSETAFAPLPKETKKKDEGRRGGIMKKTESSIMKINRQIERQESNERRSTEKRANLNPMEKSKSTLSRSNTARQK